MDQAHTTTLVTGASRRIGRALAQACLARGERVVAHRRSADAVPEPFAAPVEAWCWDMQQPLDSLPAQDIDHLILSASLFERGHAWNALSADGGAASASAEERERFARHLQVNLLAPWELAVRLNARRPLRSVTMLLDTYLDRSFPGHAAYQVSRAAGAGLVRALAAELAPCRVNAVAPGTVLPSVRDPAQRAEQEDAIKARTLLGRIGSVEDVVDAAMYLRDAAYVTGEILRVDGGRFKL
ncbi:SDR family oxidoreductase [Lysobacter enzymogenes]|uniref:SDR family oxidoreductase n=1 Tax=Lysobacter enzymogenes TaxID=69 RepID=A0A3N2REK0_LYSEN|nr:SDR family oxidoreductase [Lysobacter enzymogenes]ROU05883.1 SDR family oxidoreductase [Lysobacter enzymogenes]